MRLPTPGEIFQGKYQLHEVLGRGGFAAVYRAVDVEIGREVAIKILTPGDSGYAPEVVARFMREARVIGAFRDPHTITMFDFGRSDDELLYMVFEYVAGEDLSVVVANHGPMGPDTVVHILEQLLASLREAHDAGVLHRDIKPANVLVYSYMGDAHRVKLLDFGIATFVEGTAGAGANITNTGMVIGSPAYMAPERILGLQVTPASDLFSLGLVAHEMLVGKQVFGGDSREQLREQLSDQPLLVPPQARTDEGLCLVVDRLTAREQSHRFQSADEALRALRSRAIAPPPMLDVTTERGGGDAASDGLSGRTILLAGLVAGAVVLGVLSAASVLLKDEPPPPVTRLEQLLPPPTRDERPRVRPAAPSSRQERDAGFGDVPGGVEVGTSSRPASGCGEEAAWAGEKNLRIEVDGQWRSWFTYLPKNYDPNRKHPVVLAFPPRLKSGRTVARDLNLLEVAEIGNFIVIAPNISEGELDWKGRDAAFIQRALGETAKITCADMTRIFAIGSGTGAKMARKLACRMPLSGIALVSSGLRDQNKICSTPTIRFHGDADPYLPVDGGPNCIGAEYMSLRDAEAKWKWLNGCRGKASRYSVHENGRCETWRCEVDFVSCRLVGGNDFVTAAPRPIQFPGCSGTQIDYPVGRKAWSFFRKHGRRLETSRTP